MSEDKKYLTEEEITNFLLNLNEEDIEKNHFSEFSRDVLRKLIRDSDENSEIFKRIMLLDYRHREVKNSGKIIHYNLDDFLFSYNITTEENSDEKAEKQVKVGCEDENNRKMAKKFFLNLIKTKESFNKLCSEDIGSFIYGSTYDDGFKDFFEDKDGQFILAKMLTKYFIPKNQEELMDNKNCCVQFFAVEIYNTNDKFIEIISLLDPEEIEQIDLSYILPENRVEEVLKLMLENDKFKNNLPKFNIDSISRTLLYFLIKEGRITNSNVVTDLISNLDFLKEPEKFNIIQNILQRKEGKPFFSGEEYNIEDLKNLAKFLKPSEIRSFAEAYCECSNPKIMYEREDLDKILNKEVIISNIDISKMITDDYFSDKNAKYLSLEGNEDGYKKNRQENLYFLISELEEKLAGRLERLKNKNKDTDISKNKRILELERDIRKLQSYFEYLSKFRNNEGTDELCNQIRAEEILNFVSEKYGEEVFRRAIINYHRRIEPFVLKNFSNNNEAEEITKNIEDALTVLFDIYSLGVDKMKAKNKLAENLKKIGDKYKEDKKNKTFGSYLMLSSICNATNIVELSNAIYATIRNKMVNDYMITQKSANGNLKSTKTLNDLVENNDKGVNLNNLLLFRGYDKNVNDYKKFMSDPLAQVGRLKYNFWDMTYSYDNLDVNYGYGNGKSQAGSLTSFSTDASVSLDRYCDSFISVYKIPKNFYKSFRFILTNLSEFNTYDIPLEYRMFNVVFNNNNQNDISSVQFNENMDFVAFKIRPTSDIKFIDSNGKNVEYKKDETITVDKYELEEIILKWVKNKEKLKSFLNNNLIIERVFERNKILNDVKQQEMYDELDKNELKLKKTLEIENRIEVMEHSIKPFDMAKPKQSSLESNNKERVMYAIPDTHGSYSSLKEDLIKIGVVIDDGRNDFIYYDKKDYGLRHPIYKEPKNSKEYIKVPYLTLNSDFDGDIVQLGDLIDRHMGKEERSRDCLATSILLSRQLKHNYTTLIGNHEITNFVADNTGRYIRYNRKDCEGLISEAIKNGEIKLLHYSPETNLVSSHVLLLRDNVMNFINETILKNMEEFKDYHEQIEKLTKILGLKLENGKYEEEENKCLLDIDPADEEDVKNFVDIINELFLATFNTGKDEIIRTLLGTLINENRFYKTDENGMDYAVSLKPIYEGEKVKNHIYKGLRIVMGHDMTPFREAGSQKQLLKNATILLTDENQSATEPVCFKITSNEYGENRYHSWKGYAKDGKGFEEIGFLGPDKSFENLVRNIKKLLEKNEKDINNGQIIDINDKIKETIKRCTEFFENNEKLGIDFKKIELLGESNTIRKVLFDDIVELLKTNDEKTIGPE